MKFISMHLIDTTNAHSRIYSLLTRTLLLFSIPYPWSRSTKLYSAVDYYQEPMAGLDGYQTELALCEIG